MAEDINIQMIDMDVMIPEQVVQNPDGSYTIFLNARLSHERHLETYAHAMHHILNHDFDKQDVQQIEYDAHKTGPMG